MIDNDIVSFFITSKQKINPNYTRNIDKYPEYKNYLLNRFPDEQNLIAIIWRIYYKQEVRNICPICGNITPFDLQHAKRTGIVYKTYCCASCAAKSKERNKKYKDTCLQKYGVINPLCLDEVHQRAITNAQIESVKEKRKATLKEKYGAETIFLTEHFHNKSIETLNEKYGVDHPMHSKEIREKLNNTNIEKYGTKWIIHSEYFKEKSKQTCISRFGVDNYLKSEQNIINSHSKEAIDKCNETKRRNHSFNTSKDEIIVYNALKEKFGENVIKQYKSDSYPFRCDFYIPNLDLYIECNFHWTHGGHPYDSKNTEDINKVNKWKQYNSKYYDNAIGTWTKRDVAKRQTAKENNLNYIEFWSIKEAIYRINNDIL